MDFLKPVDKFLVTHVFQPIIQKSNWSQYTWANLAILFYCVFIISFENRGYIKGQSGDIDIFTIIWFSSFGGLMIYHTNKNKKASIFKDEQDRISKLLFFGLVFILFASLEILMFVLGIISNIYFQANMSNPFDFDEGMEN